MENLREYITEHKDHMEWLKEFEFCRKEISFFEGRLAEILKNHQNSGMRPRAEQFQNQFIRQREIIDIMEHKVNIHEFENAELAKLNNGHIPDHCAIDHLHMREEIKIFWKIYEDLKGKFNHFCVACKVDKAKAS
ncbi:hypothetical protein [Xanthovirga aplysinae]|uniref:hypothetical protein n=1 Tax=Xanthovirga aplysinae TaxID=2529853 RepID=UPI0012BBD9C2|nr:hypothetical protein [Xanthovirga aplysinae]MTI31977.1 hypothetical protein [Xanthovirga aplysinae]